MKKLIISLLLAPNIALALYHKGDKVHLNKGEYAGCDAEVAEDEIKDEFNISLRNIHCVEPSGVGWTVLTKTDVPKSDIGLDAL